MFYQFNLIAENKPGVIYRLANILLKRKINILKINAYPLKKTGYQKSKVSFTSEIDEKKVEIIARQIKKIIEIERITYKKVNLKL